MNYAGPQWGAQPGYPPGAYPQQPGYPGAPRMPGGAPYPPRRGSTGKTLALIVIPLVLVLLAGVGVVAAVLAAPFGRG
ncbi:hypothetical protein IU433_24640 [Nocardia puris]|uniref:Uncharacterized protein n=1 Tax=Nocardia puris TaxID=208602 RepID=A0A366DJ24_9NOCA|nr:hypothetical protein [Nocardia puris]MBF6213323.1 hypothetical protein [Nocardia puris]MBF6369509.1 hypothetical protein [Nocardia puris]MBF6462202.1 hypothetical protein [Nocardia puris]RBO89509.1 hypothetical protein DFR74_107187 [Nocardia puris]